MSYKQHANITRTLLTLLLLIAGVVVLRAVDFDIDFTKIQAGDLPAGVASVANDGKTARVVGGTATSTSLQAAGTTYEMGNAGMAFANAAKSPATRTVKLYELVIPTAIPTDADYTAEYAGEFGNATTTYTYGTNYWALDANSGSYLRYSSGNAKLTVTLPTGLKFEEGDVIKYTYQDGSTSKITYPIFKSNTTSTSIDGEKDADAVDRGEHTASIIVGTSSGQFNIVGESSFNVERGGGGTVDLKALSVEREVSGTPTPTYPITATWDFQNELPSTITSINYQSTGTKTGTVASDQDGIELYVDATNGKLAYTSDQGGYAQFNQNTIIRVPVNTTSDEVTVVAYPGQFKYTIGGVAAAQNTEHHTATPAEVTVGYVDIVATAQAYLYSISVTQNGPKEESPTRTFKDFEIDLTKDPVGDLPEGVTQVGYSNHGASFNGSHGWMWYAIKFNVDGPVKITLGGCQYTGGIGDAYEAYVTDKTGAKVLDIPTKTVKCENVTAVYNVEGDNTLTLYCGQYCTSIKVEACDYIPQVTVNYYDVDKTTLLETEVVNGSSALTYNASAVSKVTVADGKCYRGFWKNKADDKKVAEGFTLNADIELYPSVTDIETPTKTSEHTFTLDNGNFYIEEHDIISVSGGSLNAQHGWQFAKDQYMNVMVAGNATITVGLCLYAGSGDFILQKADGTEISRVKAKVASDKATHTFIYEGDATTLKLVSSENSGYIHSIKITHTGDLTLPVWNETESRWQFSTKATDALNAQELLYAMGFVNSQTEHAKTLFIPNGTYDLGTTTMTSIAAGMYLIGESQDGVLIKNQPTEESINATATLKIDGANVTLENMTIKCRAPYSESASAERGVCVQDCGNGTRYINVTLDGLQDTYYSNGANGMTATFDNCTVMGNVDFFCGNGNITINNSHILIVSPHKVGSSPIICAPATYTEETQGYVFNNCVVDAAPSSRSANAFDCATAGHSTAIVDNNYYLARAWYAGGSATEGKDRTPRITFNDTELHITPKDNWDGSIGYKQAEERRVFTVLSDAPEYSDEAKLITSTNKPFAFATATDRTDPNSVSSSNITGGGVYSIEDALALLPNDWDHNTSYTASNGKTVIVLKSANTKDANQNIVRVPMEDVISSAIAQNDIILFDGNGGVDNEFVVAKSMSFKGSAQGGSCDNKTILGINGAKIATEWYMTAAYKNALENIQTSSGTGVNSASTASGTGGSFKYKNGTVITINEEGEFLTRSTLYEMVEEKYYKKHGTYLNDEPYKHAGIFYFSGVQNLIFRNLVLQGPGSIDVGGEDLMSVINGAKHVWVDHCEFIDGIDGNFDITNHSDFVTVSWCRFSYTDRSYAHQNTNLVGSDDAKTDDRQKLNITFAYNEWGANCRARMPMARYGKIHMLNNYYNCAGNAEPTINPRKESEFLIEGNYFAKGVANIYKESSSTAVNWQSDNVIMDKAGTAGTSKGGTVTVPYQYSIIDAKSVPDVVTLNAGAVLGKSPVFDPDLMEVLEDNEGNEIKPKLSEFQAGGQFEDGLVLSVWAENAHTFQWYKAEVAEDGTVGEFAKIEGANRNSLSYKPTQGETIQLYCKAFGVSGSATTQTLTLTIDGETKPIYTLNLDDTNTYAVTSGSPQIFTVNAGDAGVTYQWYKSANADGSGATAIDGETGKSYTYNPTTAEVIYLFCRAHNAQGDTDSKIVKVKATSRNVKFHMYATYDANAKESSLFVEGATSNIDNVGTTTANINADADGCKAEVNRTKDISGLRFENASTSEHANPLGVSARFTPTTAIANGDKIEVSINTSSTSAASTDYGFYVCKAAELGTEKANVIGTITVNGNALKTETFTATEEITNLYLIPFVGGAGKNVNLANVVVYIGDITKPVDDPVFTKDLEERYEVMKDATLTLEVDYVDNDVASVHWYKNSANSVTGATAIQDATSKTLSVPTTELGTTFYYCVLTGQAGHANATSTIAKVVVTDEVQTQTVEIVWDMKDCPGNTSTSETSIPKGTVKEIPSTTDPDNTIIYHVRTGADDAYRVNAQNFTDEGKTITWTAYIKTGGSSAPASLSGVYEIDVPKAGQIVVYSRSAGSSVRYTYVTQSKVNPAADGTGTGVVGQINSYVNGAAANVVLKANVVPGKAYVGVTSGTYIYAIKYIYQENIVPGTVDVKLGLTQEVNTTAKTIGSAVYSNGDNSNLTVVKQIGSKCNDGQTGKKPYYKNGTAAAEQYTAAEAFRKTANTTTWDNNQYIGYKVSVANGYVLALNKATLVLADASAAAYTCKVSIQDENGNVIKETSAITTEANTTTSNIWGLNATDLAGDVYVKLMIYQGGSNKYFALPEFTVEGTVAPDLSTQCKKPSASKGDYVPAQEGYIYTLSSKTPSAKLHYKVDGGTTVDCTSNRVAIVVPCGKSVVVWATDGNGVLDQSEEFEFTASAIPQLEQPGVSMTVYSHTTDPKGFTITLTKNATEEVYYTTDGTVPSKDSETAKKYTSPFIIGGNVVVRAIAVKDHYTDSPEATLSSPAVSSPGTDVVERSKVTSGTTYINASYTLDKQYIGGYANNISTGFKMYLQDNKVKIDVVPGFVITGIEGSVINNYDTDATLTAINVDNVDKMTQADINIPRASTKTPIAIEKISNIQVRNSLEFIFTETQGTDTKARGQINMNLIITYEFDDSPASVKIDGTSLNDTQLEAYKTDHIIKMEGVYPDYPEIIITTEKGYEYSIADGTLDDDGYTSFSKSFLGVEYIVKAKIAAVKSPNINIDDNLSLKGGYRVTLSGDFAAIEPYINIDGAKEADGKTLKWELYDPAKEYYAIDSVKSKAVYTDSGETYETQPRTANCPANLYEPGKPFAVFVRQPSYLDSQDGANPYNTLKPEETDKIYKALTAHYNVIDFCKPSGTEVLTEMPDIADAKLVVITEMISGSGSYNMDGKDTKSTALTMTLKRDVVDKTNVINFKMFTYSQSKNNTDRWAWAQPVALPSSVVTITPVKPADGMYEVFGDAMVNRDGTITLWNTYDTDHPLNHLQPVFNFREADVDEEGNPTEELPVFTPLAYAYDPDNLDETYHILHYYDKTADGKTTTYVGFGLSVNEWTNYGNNIEAIVGKIAEMIATGRPLDSKLEGLVDPKVADNGDGSATVINNNQNASTYYLALSGADVTAFEGKTVDEQKSQIIAANTQPNDDYATIKYVSDMVIYAVSEYNGVYSNVVKGEIRGSRIRYIIRENDDMEAKGMMARYRFEVNEDGSAKAFDFPYNQSWSKEGYTVTSWIGADGNTYIPGASCNTLTQDLKVTAVWTANKHKLTDLQNESKEQRTVTWKFRLSEGAPALALESTAGKMQAIIVGQAKFNVYDAEGNKTGEEWIDVPMTINTDHSEVLPDNGASYHGKFNNSQNNFAEKHTVGGNEYTGDDYAQVRTGTQFTFPTIAGSNILYKQIDLVEADKTTGNANGNVCRSQISQSKLTDATGTVYAVRNPGYKLDAEGKIIFVDGKAQLATPADLTEDLQNDIKTMEGRGEYEYDKEGVAYLGGNASYGGLIFYNGEEKMATLTSIESAQYIEHADAAKKGTLNAGSVFMQSLSVTYPQLYDFDYELVPEESELEGANEKAAEVTVVTPARANCDGRYSATQTLYVTVKPSYGYYVGADGAEIKYTAEEAAEENAKHLAEDPNGNQPGMAGYVTTYEQGWTELTAESVKATYTFLQDGGSSFNVRGNEAVARYYQLSGDGDAHDTAESINAEHTIPNDGAVVKLYLINRGKVTISLLKRNTYKYNVMADPGTYGIVQYNTGNGRAHEDEYLEFPEGATMYMVAKPKMGYRFVKWRLNSASDEEGGVDLTESNKIDGTTIGDGEITNPFDPTDRLEKNELQFIVSAANSQPKYVAIFELAEEGTAHYLFTQALLEHQDGTYTHLDLTPEEINAFPDEFTSTALNIPYYYTLYKEGYTLDHWVENKNGSGDVDLNDPGKTYKIGTFYYYDEKDEQRYLIPVFKENELSYDYRATSMDITWDFRSVQYAQRVTFTQQQKPASSPIYYSTHATFNGKITVDVPLKISIGDEGRFVNTVIDEWCEFGEGTQIVIPSGLGATFTLATYAPITTTNFDGVVPTEYEIRQEEGIDVYYYTYTTPSTSTSVTLTIDNDYSYYKSLRAQLPSADNVPLRVSVNNPDYGSIKLMKAESSTNEDITNQVKQTTVEEKIDGETYTKFTLGMGTAITIQADRQRLYVVDYYEDAYGNRCGLDEDGQFYAVDKDGNDISAYAMSKGYMVRKPTSADISAGYSKDPNNLIITTRIQTYDNKAKIYYKLNDLYQINYTSGHEAEGEAPGVVLIERGEGFTVPAANHYLYLDGYTLKYWVDEDGNKYDFGQTYTPGETFVNNTGKSLPSGLAAGGGFQVPAKDLFLSPHFEINEFTVLNLAETATAVWPLTREGKVGTVAEGGYAGNSGVIIYYQRSVGVYVTPLKLSDGRFIDLKLDINCASVGKVDNRTQGDRCQINGETVMSIPASSNCDLSLYTVNGKLSTTKIAGQKITSNTVHGSNEKGMLHYTGESSVVDIEYAGEAGYFYQLEGVYYPIDNTHTMPELDYVTVGNISLGAVGTQLADKKLSTLKNLGEISEVKADLSASVTGIMPQVKAMATNNGYVEVSQATIDNPTATLLLKTEDGVTVAVYKISFNVIPPVSVPLLSDVKVSNQYQCDLDKLDDGGKEGTYYYGYKNGDGTLSTTSDYLIEIQDAGINGTIALTFDKTMKAATLDVDDFLAIGGMETLSQSITSSEGQMLVFSYWNLKLDTEYDFEIKADQLVDVYGNRYPHPIRLHFRTTATTTEIKKQLINFVVTHNQPSKINTEELKMETDGERQQIATDELIANLEVLKTAGKIAGYGTLDEGIRMANEYEGKGRFYIFVPDGEYQLMGNTPLKMKYASGNFAPADEQGKLHDEVLHASNGGRETQNGLTSISHSNVSITGQSQTRTVVWNRPWVEGIEYTSTLHLNSGTTGFYAQDMTLDNRFDYATSISKQGSASAQAARAVVLWDQGSKAIMKNVSLLSYQDTYYSKTSSPKTDDTRGYYEDCTFAGYVDFFCGDGDHWFERCDLMLRPGKGTNAANMIASRQVEQQQWGYVYNNCAVIAEEGTNAMTLNDGKFTISRPWDNSPAVSLLYTTFHVLPTDDGYKAMSKTGQLLRIHEFRSMYPNGTLIDLSARSLRNSSPGAGSYDAVMTPAEARTYEIHNVMGGADGYDPTLYTRQRPAPVVSQDDQYMVWDEDPEALCYFVFRSLSETDTTSYQLYTIATDDYRKVRISDNNMKDYYYRVRAANQRGGLGWYSDPIKYKDLGYYDLKAKAIDYTYGDDAEKYKGYTWSTICLPFGASVPEGSWNEATETVNTEDPIRVFAPTEYMKHQLKLERVQHLDSLRGYVVYARPGKTYRFFGSTYPSERETILDGYAPEYVDVLNQDGKPTGSKQPSQVMLDRLQANVNCYTLSYKSAFGIGFYPYKGDNLNPYKAWLDASLVVDDDNDTSSPSGGRIRFVFDDFEMPDDISVIETDSDEDRDQIFDLHGHRVQRDQLRPGNIYIISGKKVMY